MKIQLISDIHLEFFDSKVDINDIFDVSADILIIAGDLGYPTKPNYNEFLRQCSAVFQHVLLVNGNHEYYCIGRYSYDNMSAIDNLVNDICSQYENVHFLHNKTIEINNYIFMGSVLWSYIKEEEMDNIKISINDYKYIFNGKEKITPQYINNLYETNRDWLVSKIDEYQDKNIIVISHHVPSYKLTGYKFKNSPLNPAFANRDLENLFSKVNYWFYGHTHDSNFQRIEDCLCYVNAHGYQGYNEHTGFNKSLVIDTDDYDLFIL